MQGLDPNNILSEQETQRLQEQIEKEMMEHDRQIESQLVSSLIQLETHKQSLLLLISKIREEALTNQKRQKQFMDLLLAHQKS